MPTHRPGSPEPYDGWSGALRRRRDTRRLGAAAHGTTPETRSTLLDFASRDPARIRRATFALSRTRDPERLAALFDHLERIELLTRGLDAGATVGLAHVLERIRMFHDGICMCATYPRASHYDPAREASDGHVRIIGEVPVLDDAGKAWPPIRVCECTGCGSVYEVHDREYHAPWWEWSARDGDTASG